MDTLTRWQKRQKAKDETQANKEKSCKIPTFRNVSGEQLLQNSNRKTDSDGKKIKKHKRYNLTD